MQSIGCANNYFPVQEERRHLISVLHIGKTMARVGQVQGWRENREILLRGKYSDLVKIGNSVTMSCLSCPGLNYDRIFTKRSSVDAL
jgi:hypothetical protein